jgi:biopolymer transport protein ExbD
MKFEKAHRREPIEPQLATMIDVFSILIIFLIAGTAMDSSILNIPGNLLLPETKSTASTINAPQVTLSQGIVNINFINKSLPIKDIENMENSLDVSDVKLKIKDYLSQVTLKNKRKTKELQMLQSINLVADKEVSYDQLFAVIKFFRTQGFQNTILVGVEGSGK